MKADGFAHPYLTVKFLTLPGLTPSNAVLKERFVAKTIIDYSLSPWVFYPPPLQDRPMATVNQRRIDCCNVVLIVKLTIYFPSLKVNPPPNPNCHIVLYSFTYIGPQYPQ
jgi:hypothetical protein